MDEQGSFARNPLLPGPGSHVTPDAPPRPHPYQRTAPVASVSTSENDQSPGGKVERGGDHLQADKTAKTDSQDTRAVARAAGGRRVWFGEQVFAGRLDGGTSMTGGTW
jgi:hypothetical protein